MSIKRVVIGNKNTPKVRLAAGAGEPTRVLASMGVSSNATDVQTEFKKAKIAVESGADIVNDLSIIEPLGSELRKCLLEELNIPINSEPIFETCAEAFNKCGDALSFSLKDVLETIQRQAEQGIGIMTLHFAYSRQLAKQAAKSRRTIPITSRGGAILTSYMAKTGAENPYRVLFDEILDVLHRNRVVVSLGTVLRPGSICDGLDQLFLSELFEQRSFIEKATDRGVQLMVEGAGHLRIDQIEPYVKLSKEILLGAPLRSLGPTLCDCGTGYDHITGCIGAAIAATHGCDFVTCTTRAEHIGLPRARDIKEAVIAFKLAAYIADIVKKSDCSKDRVVSKARKTGDWKTIWREGLYGSDAESLHRKLNPTVFPGCSMCGRYCALRLTEKDITKLLDKSVNDVR
jgi:phosphomethylpyrimidine synthase